jgi:hypothetical protein
LVSCRPLEGRRRRIVVSEPWMSPVIEFHQQHIGPVPAGPPVTQDAVVRWQPLLSDVDEKCRDELTGILELETTVIAKIMGNEALVSQFETFLRTRWPGWASESQSDHVLMRYHQIVKEKVLGRPVQ